MATNNSAPATADKSDAAINKAATASGKAPVSIAPNVLYQDLGGGKFGLIIDSKADLGVSSTGKSHRVASTGGFLMRAVADGAAVRINLNVIK